MTIATAADGFAGVISLIEEGRFKEASTALRPIGSPRRIGERALFNLLQTELLIELGDLNGCIRSSNLLEGHQDPSILCRAYRASARARFYLGDHAQAMGDLQRARASASAAEIPRLRALVELTDLTLSSGSRPVEATSSALTDLKRLVAHVGDPHLMIELRLCVARAEARSNSIREAAKHIATARTLLERYPNLWLAGTIELDASIISALQGDPDASLAYLERATNCAEQSGHFRTKLGAMINAAQLLADQGHHQKARGLFETVIRQSADHPQLLLAALDGQANLYLTQGHYENASAAFDRIGRLSEVLGDARLHWDKLTETYSISRLRMSLGQWTEAESELRKAKEVAIRSHDRIWAKRLELARAKCLGIQGQKAAAAQLLSVEVEPAESVEMVARWHGALAAAQLEDSAIVSKHLGHALRIAKGVANGALAHDLSIGLPRVGTVPPPTPTLDSAVALLEVAAHPHILAREALSLLQGSSCVDQAALVARGARSTRVLDTFGWDERDALHAARKATEADTIDCGIHRDETLTIVGRPHEDLERRCTWIAIKKLVLTALTLDRYRRDEKQRAALWPTESLEGDPDVIWVSEPINEVVRIARRIGPTPLSVLLTGETGTGKEMLARTIHLASDRADRTMLAFNCTAVPRDMLESQLFGYRKGAFTGADTSFTGVIRAAEGGTLFLDEIADVPVDVQPKLLRFLETHEIHPLGEPHPIKVDVRIIAATNANLEQLVGDGRFRQDLFYRLNVVRLRLPPLRERREEIPALVEHFVRRYGEQQKKGRISVSDEALEYLLLYPWPGNLRQLANEVNRMLAMAEADTTLTAMHLSAEIRATRRTIAVSAAPESELRINTEQPLPDAVDQLERTMVQAALDRSKGRLEDAAKILGISRKGLFLKRRRWGMHN